MKVGNWVLFCLVTLSVAAIPAAAAEHTGHPAAPQDPRLEFLKGLQGNWVGQFGQDEMGEQVFEFRVTAGGHAIEEREMIGTPMEMLTVYYLDGNDVVGTHFCMLGNRPRVKATTLKNNTLTFACNGTPGNAKSHDEEHVHGWSMRLDDDGQLHYSAELVRDGQVTEAPTVVLTRRVETASR